MLKVSENCINYLSETRDFAKSVGLLNDLEAQLSYLSGYACRDEETDRTICNLYPDFAPHSFYFVMELKNEETKEYNRWFNGGLIFFNAGESGVSGPQYTVRLDSSKSGWSIHT